MKPTANAALPTPRTDASAVEAKVVDETYGGCIIEGVFSANGDYVFIEFARQLETELAAAQQEIAKLTESKEKAWEKVEQERAYIREMDNVIDDLRVADSCINPLEDLKRAVTKLKSRADKAEQEVERLRADGVHLRMQIGYIVTELQIAGDARSTPEIVETAANATRDGADKVES